MTQNHSTPKEYVTLNTSLSSADILKRMKRQTYLFIDDKTLVNNSPRVLINILTGPQYLGKIEDINQKTLNKISGSLTNFKEFKKTIYVLPKEIFLLIEDEFLEIVGELGFKNKIDQVDYEYLKEYFKITQETIDNHIEKYGINKIRSDIAINIAETLRKEDEAIKPYELLKKYGKVHIKIRGNESDAEYNKLVTEYISKTENYIKINELYSLEKDKKRILNYFKILTQFNEDLFYNNAIINENGSFSVSKDLLEMIRIYMEITALTKEDFHNQATEHGINADIFMKYIFTDQSAVLVKDIPVFGKKKKTYTLNPVLFNKVNNKLIGE